MFLIDIGIYRLYNAGMDFILFEEVGGMTLIRSPLSIDLIRQEYTAPESGENKLLVSLFLRPSQKRIIDGLAEQTGKGKAEVLRTIIDEWCATQLERAEEGG